MPGAPVRGLAPPGLDDALPPITDWGYPLAIPDGVICDVADPEPDATHLKERPTDLVSAQTRPMSMQRLALRLPP